MIAPAQPAAGGLEEARLIAFAFIVAGIVRREVWGTLVRVTGAGADASMFAGRACAGATVARTGSMRGGLGVPCV